MGILLLNMLITPGDLIPVQASATTIPWTRRKSQVLNYLHRGPVTFSTLVYDTNVGDISALSTYFNPERVSVKDLNSRFGQYPSSGDNSRDDNVKVGCENVLKPRLLLYLEHNLNHSQVKVQRTLKWVLSHQDKERGNSPVNMIDQLPPPVRSIWRKTFRCEPAPCQIWTLLWTVYGVRYPDWVRYPVVGFDATYRNILVNLQIVMPLNF